MLHTVEELEPQITLTSPYWLQILIDMSSVPVCYWGEYSDIYTIVTEVFHLKQGHTYQIVKLATNESCYFLSIYSNLNKPRHSCIVTSLISGPVKELIHHIIT